MTQDFLTIRLLAPLIADILAEAAAGPDADELDAAPVIDIWQAVLTPTHELCLIGAVTGHPLLGIGPRRVVTSQLLLLNQQCGWCRTMSRFYRLGRLSEIRGVDMPPTVRIPAWARAVDVGLVGPLLDKIASAVRLASGSSSSTPSLPATPDCLPDQAIRPGPPSSQQKKPNSPDLKELPMTDLVDTDPPAKAPHQRHLCLPRLLPKAQEGLRQVQVVSPSAYLPPIKDVIDHLQDFAAELMAPDKPGYSVLQRARHKAEAWHEQRMVKTGLKDLRQEHRPALMRLIRNQAVILGPRTGNEVDLLFADVHAEAPWFGEVSTYLMHRVRSAVAEGRAGFCPPPIILVGRPGDGKSQFARSLAQRLSLPSSQIDVGSGTAGFRISGLERGWASAMPGIPVETIVRTGIANPMMIVDEIDKAGSLEFSGTRQSTSITTSLLQVLEPQTASSFDCPFYRTRFDLSHVVWIMTANSSVNLPDPLRDRCRVFHIPPPTPAQLLGTFDRLCADLPEDLREVGHRIIRQRLRTTKGFNLRALQRLVETLKGRTMDVDLH